MISKNQSHNFNILSFNYVSVIKILYLQVVCYSLKNKDLFIHVDFNHTCRLTLKEDETLLPKNSHPKKIQAIDHSKKIQSCKTIYSFIYLVI